MPLLGRHKSLGQGSSSKSSSRQQQQQPQSSPPPLVCESPLFGVRRQLPVATQAYTTDPSHTADNQHQASLPSSHSLSHNLSSRGGGGGRRQDADKLTRGEQQQQVCDNDLATTDSNNNNNNGLSSIPKHISRQQIHYAFSIMDTNSDGLIDLRDLSQMLANLGVPIDEAILSHVMSTVSKRGDHLINESEFLDWIGNFVQVSDLLPDDIVKNTAGKQQVSGTSTTATSSSKVSSARKAPVTRSSSASAAAVRSLAAHSPEAQFVIDQQMKQRRGSGSGLALMRSLSSSSSSAYETSGSGGATTRTTTTTKRKSSTAGKNDDLLLLAAPLANTADQLQLQLEQQQEARSDLKAAFCVFDLDGDGYITIDEVQQGLKLLGETWSQQELNQVFSKCEGGSGAGSSSPSNSRFGIGKLSSKQQQRAGADLTRQRISIDDFVKLLL